MLPSMIWNIYLLVSSGVLYIDPKNDDSTLINASVDVDSLATSPEFADWIIAHKLPASFDDPDSEETPIGVSTLDELQNLVEKHSDSLAVCPNFMHDDMNELNRRLLASSDAVMTQLSTQMTIVRALSLFFNCLINGPTTLLAVGAHAAAHVAGVNATVPTSRIENRVNVIARRNRRGIIKLASAGLLRVSLVSIHDSVIFSEKSYSTQEELEGDETMISTLADQIEGFPIFIPGEVEYDTQAYVWLSRTNRTLTLAFPGTQSATDVIHDMDFRMVPIDDLHPGVLLHSGFKGKLLSIRDDIYEILSTHHDHYDKIVYTGHSLGGALATVAAAIMGEVIPDKAHECITFGSPRVGNQEFANWFSSSITRGLRVVNERDPIIVVPFEQIYVHVSYAIAFTRELEIIKVPDPIHGRLWNAMEDFESTNHMFVDHEIGTYRERIIRSFAQHP